MVELLGDVPLPSLYRHLKKLLQGDIITVAEENRVRGTLENVYTLPDFQADLGQDDLANASREDHMRYFTTFVASLFNDFERYLHQEELRPLNDGLGYREIALNLSDEEFTDFAKDIQSVCMEAASKEATPERRRRMFSTIVIPEPK